MKRALLSAIALMLLLSRLRRNSRPNASAH